MKTHVVKAREVERRWVHIDADGQVVGPARDAGRRHSARQGQADLHAVHGLGRFRDHHELRQGQDHAAASPSSGRTTKYSGYQGGLKTESLREMFDAQARRSRVPRRVAACCRTPSSAARRSRSCACSQVPSIRTSRSSPKFARWADPAARVTLAATPSDQALAHRSEGGTMPQPTAYMATGRRKEAVARVRIVSGSGQQMVNGRPMRDYLGRDSLVRQVLQPLEVAQTATTFDIRARTCTAAV